MENTIGTIISQSRQNKGMTQEEFASRLGVTPQAVSKWERGNGLPDISLIEGICRILDVNADLLLGIKGNRLVENNNIILEKEIKNNLVSEPLLLEFGADLVPYFAEGLKTDLVNRCRRDLAAETGMLMPLLHIKDSLELEGMTFRIKSYGKVLYEGNAKENALEKPGENYYELLIQKVTEQCRLHYAEILNKQIVKVLVDNVKELYPGVADGLVPEKISYLDLKKQLQKVVREKGNIRDLIHILEELEENSSKK